MDDIVALYGQARGWSLGRRVLLVEGTTDEALFRLTRRLLLEDTGRDLFAHGLAVIAAGVGDDGGAKGLVIELHALRRISRTALTPDGRPRYRFVGLFDNDDAGRRAIAGAHAGDSSIVEYRDVFRLRPAMPREGSLDSGALRRSFRMRNAGYEHLNWELEDLISGGFLEAFLEDHPEVFVRVESMADLVHRNFGPDGKAKLHRYVRDHAMMRDLSRVADVLQSMRYYFGLPCV